MGHITKAPTYIDSSSFLSDKQIRKINSIIKGQINLFTSKATQKQKEAEEAKSIVSAYADYVVSEIDSKYDNTFFISCYVNTSSLEIGVAYDLFEFDTDIKSISIVGYYDTSQTEPFSEYADISYSDNKMILTMKSLPNGFDTAILNIKGTF